MGVVTCGFSRRSTLVPRLSANGEPGLNVLLETFLGFEAIRNDDDWPPGGKFFQQNRKKRLRRLANPGTG